MTYDKLVETIASRTGEQKAQIKSVLDALEEIAIENLKTDGKVYLPGFGTFKSVIVAGREHRNPITGAPVFVPAHRKVKFTPSKSFKEAIK